MYIKIKKPQRKTSTNITPTPVIDPSICKAKLEITAIRNSFNIPSRAVDVSAETRAPSNSAK